MRFGIVYSRKDPAGLNIVMRLKKFGFLPQIPIFDFNKETIYLSKNELNIKKYPLLRNIDFLVFASKHESKKGRPSLCVHAPGNWKKAELGGKDGKVSPTSAFVLKYLFSELNKNARESINKRELKKDYEITLEVTHHGPLIEIPCCYIEIGSSKEEWRDENAVKVVTKTILSLQYFNETDKDWIPCIGIGGPHYAQSFNKIQLNSNYAIGHIIPKYVFPLIPSMLKEAEEKTIEQIKEVLIDWKGCGKSEERQRVIEIIEKSGLKWKKANS